MARESLGTAALIQRECSLAQPINGNRGAQQEFSVSIKV